jgi:hypothetical protein
LIGTYHVADCIQDPIFHHNIIAFSKLLEKLKHVAYIVPLKVVAILLGKLLVLLLKILRLLKDCELLL